MCFWAAYVSGVTVLCVTVFLVCDGFAGVAVLYVTVFLVCACVAGVTVSLLCVCVLLV